MPITPDEGWEIILTALQTAAKLSGRTVAFGDKETVPRDPQETKGENQCRECSQTFDGPGFGCPPDAGIGKTSCASVRRPQCIGVRGYIVQERVGKLPIEADPACFLVQPSGCEDPPGRRMATKADIRKKISKRDVEMLRELDEKGRKEDEEMK